MTWTPLKSSNVEAMRHDPASGELHLRFKGGATYRYTGVDADAAKALAEAESPGRYVREHIVPLGGSRFNEEDGDGEA
jgi:hypothetical protein